MKLGAIGDDFTGASDLGLVLARGGAKVTLYMGTPDHPAENDVEAGIVALKTRSLPINEAVEQSLEAFAWLCKQGCTRFFLKYCSTFDSTPEGNIGPVIDALIDKLGTDKPVIVCPAFPENGRTVYNGHLFVGDRLLSESGMEVHPLTPMTDPDLRRWLQQQTCRSVGHLSLRNVRHGKIAETFASETDTARQLIVCDAIEDKDLVALGHAAASFPLITGGSGIALALPEALKMSAGNGDAWQGAKGRSLAISGSCSKNTRHQISVHLKSGRPALKIDASEIIGGNISISSVLDWVEQQQGLPLVYTSGDPAAVHNVQMRFGRNSAAERIEHFLGELASEAVEQGVTRLISAGGETSGAVIKALRIQELQIGPLIDPGIPALRHNDPDITLALKSGNFGAPDFFAKASRVLAGELH